MLSEFVVVSCSNHFYSIIMMVVVGVVLLFRVPLYRGSTALLYH